MNTLDRGHEQTDGMTPAGRPSGSCVQVIPPVLLLRTAAEVLWCLASETELEG